MVSRSDWSIAAGLAKTDTAMPEDRKQKGNGRGRPACSPAPHRFGDPKGLPRSGSDRGRDGALSCAAPPSEPDVRLSRIRLSSQHFAPRRRLISSSGAFQTEQPETLKASAHPCFHAGIARLSSHRLRRLLAGSSIVPRPNRVHLSSRSVCLLPLLPTPPRGDEVTSASRRPNRSQRPGSPTPEEDAARQRTSTGLQPVLRPPPQPCPF